MYTLLYLKWTYCMAHGTLFNVMWQPGWEGHLEQNAYMYTAAAAAKSLQSCPTLCDPRDGSMAKSLHCSPETITTLLSGYS